MIRWLLLLAFLLSCGPLWFSIIDQQLTTSLPFNPIDAGLVMGGVGMLLAGLLPARSGRERTTRFLLAVALLIAAVVALSFLVVR